MQRSHFMKAAAAALILLSAFAHAQPAPGPQPGASAPRQLGPSGGPRGPEMIGPHGRAGSRYTPGWSMMSAREREEHRARMNDARSYDDCRSALDSHLKMMEQRARERGMRMRGPRGDACGGWKK